MRRLTLASTLFWGISSFAAGPEIVIAPAVEISWSSEPNRMYQVEAADNLVAPVWTEAGSPVAGTGATVRQVLYRGDANHAFFRVMELDGTVANWLAGLTELDFRPSAIVAQDGGIRAEGVRVNAIGITPEDLVTTRFQFDLETQSLKLVHYSVVPRIGVFYDRFFARNAGTQLQGLVGRETLPEYTWLTASGTNIVLKVDLAPGHVFNYGVTQPSREHSVELLGPDGERIKYSIMAADSTYREFGQPILRGGSYQVRIRPRSSSSPLPSMSCRLFFANSNASRLQELADGAWISTLLRQNTHDYDKYRVRLNRGQVLRMARPDAGIGILVLNSSSEKLSDLVGLPLIFEAPKEDTYYVFVYRVLPGLGDLHYTTTASVRNS